MSDEDFDDPFSEESRTLLIDGDILIYKPCCIFNDEDVRSQEQIASNVRAKVTEMCHDAGCDSYQVFLTTKKNFRDFITDDYKANRQDVERPVNLAWAKHWAVKELGGEVVVGLEADDLLAMNQTENTVIWSPDKDLMQVTGWHLDDGTNELVYVEPIGEIWQDNKKKWRFSGFKGLMFQALTGDTADYIIGCGKRITKVYKSGKNKGQEYIARDGVGPAAAASILNSCEQNKKSFKQAVADEYKKLHGNKWMVEMEKQVNLLYMVENYRDGKIQNWTFDGRRQFMNITDGETYEEEAD